MLVNSSTCQLVNLKKKKEMNKTILSLAAFVAASTLTINAENVNTTDTDSANVETAQTSC